MEKSKTETKRQKDSASPPRINRWVPRIAFLAFCVLAALFLAQWLIEANAPASGQPRNGPQTPEASNVASVLTVTAAQTPATVRDGTSAPSQEEVARQKDELTELQWIDYAMSLEGLQIEGWHGWVYNVRKPDDETGQSKVEISLDRFSDGSLHYYEVIVQLPPDDARLLNRNGPVQFSGYIADVTCSSAYCTFHLEDVELTPGT
jgi:hypothetical protein